MDVAIKQMPAYRVGTIRHTGPYNQIPAAFARLGAIAGPAGLFQHPGAAMLAIYHDDPESTPPDQLRSDAGISIPGGVPVPAGLVEQHLPAGEYACTLHVGPYEGLGDTWLRLLGEWLPASGRRMGAGPSYELYLNNPMQVAKEDLRTELYIHLLGD
jgi:AraC family transcriptional regulator